MFLHGKAARLQKCQVLRHHPAVIDLQPRAPHGKHAQPGAGYLAMHKGWGKQLAAGLENPVNFCQSFFRPGHNVQGVGDQHRIKGFVRIGQAGGILHRKVQPRPAGFQLCLGDHFGRKIRSLPVPHQAGKPEAELAGPAGQFQHVHFRRQVRLHLLRNGSIQRLAALHQRAIAAGPPLPELLVIGLF